MMTYLISFVDDLFIVFGHEPLMMSQIYQILMLTYFYKGFLIFHNFT